MALEWIDLSVDYNKNPKPNPIRVGQVLADRPQEGWSGVNHPLRGLRLKAYPEASIDKTQLEVACDAGSELRPWGVHGRVRYVNNRFVITADKNIDIRAEFALRIPCPLHSAAEGGIVKQLIQISPPLYDPKTKQLTVRFDTTGFADTPYPSEDDGLGLEDLLTAWTASLSDLGATSHSGRAALLDHSYSWFQKGPGDSGDVLKKRTRELRYNADGDDTYRLGMLMHDRNLGPNTQLWPINLIPQRDPAKPAAFYAQQLPATESDFESRWDVEIEFDDNAGAPAPGSVLAQWNDHVCDAHLALMQTMQPRQLASVVPRFVMTNAPLAWTAEYEVRFHSKRFHASLFTLLLRGPSGGVDADVELPYLHMHDGSTIRRRLRVVPLAPQTDRTLYDAAYALSFADVTSAKDLQECRIGTLDLAFAPSVSSNPPTTGILAAFLHGSAAATSELPDPTQPSPPSRARIEPRLEIRRFRIPVANIAPAAPDALTGDAAGLLFAPEPIPWRTEDRHLTITESTRSGEHTLELELSPSTSSAVPPLIALTREPFGILRLEVPSLSHRALWGSNSKDGGVWRFGIDYQTERFMNVVWPPQAVGEEMVKAYKKGDVSTPVLPFRFRFAAPGRTRLRMTRPDAPWSLDQLFGDAHTPPNALVDTASFEMLYGLTTTVDGRRLVIRPSELATHLGVAPEPFAASDGDLYRKRDNQLFGLARRRLQHVSVRDDSDGVSRTTVARGLTFSFRPTRHAAYPIDPATATLPPLDPQTDKRYQHPPPDPPADPPNDEWGLRGGVDWGFESKNILEEVTGSASVGGQINGLAWSPLGAYGFQKAVFANGKSTIYTDVVAGRTTYYALERIGRIGKLWNRAKHVIVYERTVGASSQFPDHDPPLFEGAPIVRKVREYVELLERERKFPDDGSPQQTRGFLLGSRFVDSIIPVDSAWGHDTPTGWLVPLYRRVDGYDEPHATFKFAARGEDVTYGRIGNPDELVFYTSTIKSDTADTDLWDPVPGVDFGFEQIPVVDALPPAPASDGRLPDPPAVDPKQANGTFHIEGLADEINLVAGRMNATAQALIHNVTIGRRALTGVVPAINNAIANYWQNVVAKVTSYDETVRSWLELLEQTWSAKPAEFAAWVEARRKELLVGDTALVTQIQSATAKLDAHATRLVERQTALLDTWSASKSRQALVKEAREKLEARLGDVTAPSVAAAQAILDELGGRVGGAGLVVNEVERRLARFSVAAEVKVAKVEVERWTDELAKAKAKSANELRAAFLDVANRFESALARIRKGADELLPAAIATHVAGLAARFNDELGAIAADYEAWAAAFQPTKLKEELLEKLELAKQLDETVEKARTSLRDRVKDVTDKVATQRRILVGKAESLLRAESAHLETELQAAVSAMESKVKTAVEESVKDLSLLGLENVLGELKELGDALRTEITGVLSSTGMLVHAAASAVVVRNEAIAAEALAIEPLKSAALSARNLAQAALQRIRLLFDGYRRAAASAFEQLLRLIDDIQGQLTKLGDRAFRLLRAFGDAPKAIGMELSRDRLAYYFHEAAGTLARGVRDAVDFTPAAALVNRVGREIGDLDLKTMGLRLPTSTITDRLLPDLRKSLDLGALFPDFAGLRLGELLQNAIFPSGQPDGVKVTHGIDRGRRVGWAQVDIDVKPDDVTIVDKFGFRLWLRKAELTAKTRVEVDTQQGMRRMVDARILANFELETMDQMVAALKKTTLELDGHGGMRFHFEPSHIEIAAALKFLTDLLSRSPMNNGSGLTLEPVLSGNLPVGIRALLNLALPTLQAGAFSMSNLAVSLHFGMHVEDGFVLAGGLGVSSKERPFNISILCLGGGGWLTTEIRHIVGGPRPGTYPMVSIGIAVGASLPFDIGVARGGVQLLVSFGLEWSGRKPVSMELAITARGEVVVLGIVSILLELRLSATYQVGGTLLCRGTVKVKIKIGFFSVGVNVGMSFKFGSGGGAGLRIQSLAAPTDAVRDYFALFGVAYD